MEGLTILGGKGFVGGQYVKNYYHHAVGNIVSINEREDYGVYSADVLYFISTVHNQNVYTDPFLDIDTNLTTLIKVLENWRKRPDASEGVFNFISSWFVGSDVKGFYTSTKRCAEELLIEYCKAFGLQYRILRLSNVVGPGDTKTSKVKNALQYVIGQLSRDEKVTLRPVKRQYIHVEDCSRAIDTVIVKGEKNRVYNIGNYGLVDFAQSVEQAKNYVRSKSSIIYVPGDDNSYEMDTRDLYSLGYSPKYTGKALIETLCEGK
jgi:nucleoside-diphosphate-sugar epimerase